MKTTTCQDCKRTREVKDDVSMAICLCGNTLNFNRNPILSNDLNKIDQVIIKEVFNRGVEKGKPLSANEIINDLDTRIKVNLK